MKTKELSNQIQLLSAQAHTGEFRVLVGTSSEGFERDFALVADELRLVAEFYSQTMIDEVPDSGMANATAVLVQVLLNNLPTILEALDDHTR